MTNYAKWRGLSARNLAALVGVKKETVYSWRRTTNPNPIPGSVVRLLQILDSLPDEFRQPIIHEACK